MKDQRHVEMGEVKPRSDKKVWATPALEIIGTDNVAAGSISKGIEGKGTFPFGDEIYMS